MTRRRDPRSLPRAEGIRARTAAPRRRIDHGGKHLLVFDELFTAELVAAVAGLMASLDYRPRPSFDQELSFGFTTASLRTLPALVETTDALVRIFAGELGAGESPQVLSHGYAAATRFGDSTAIHQDVACADCITFLYFGNFAWRGEWGGEIILYDDALDAIGAVTPHPGRLLMFNAALFHRTGVPNRTCPSFRYAMSLFYRCEHQLAQK